MHPKAFIRGTGSLTLRMARPAWRTAGVLSESARSFARLSFFNTACYRELVRHIDETAVRALPMTCAVALVVGSVTVHYLLSILTGLGAYDQIGTYLIDSMLHEIAPLAVTIIIMTRSGTTVLSELAIMSHSGEMDTIRALGIAPRDYVYLPRVMAFAVAGPALTVVFCLVALVGGFLVMGYMQDITLANYLDQIADALELNDLFFVAAKPFLLALCVAGICIQRGLSMHVGLTELPRLLIQGLLHVLACIVAVEVVFVLLTW